MAGNWEKAVSATRIVEITEECRRFLIRADGVCLQICAFGGGVVCLIDRVCCHIGVGY